MRIRYGLAALWLSFSVLVLAAGCGGSPNPGDGCSKNGEQVCSKNRELNCESGTWKLGEDCDASGTTCVVKSGGDADCESAA